MRLLTLSSALVCVIFLKLGATENYAEAACSEDSLPCDDGHQCVKRHEWCDKSKNCQDESDERYCKKRHFFNSDPNDCEDTHFRCDDGRCVPLVAKCDGHNDCSDKSDEICKPEPTDGYNDYDTDRVETTTEHTISETFSEASPDISEEENILNPTPVPTLAFISIGTSDEPILSSTVQVDFHLRENEEFPTHAPIPVSTLDTALRSPNTPGNFYSRRIEEDRRESGFQPPSSTVSSYVSPVTTETVHGPGAYQTQDVQTTTTTSQSQLSSTTISSTRPHYSSRHYDNTRAPVPQSYSSKVHHGHSTKTTSQPTTSYDSKTPDQWRASITHPTRSYVGHTDHRRDSYHHTTQPTRPYVGHTDHRRDSYHHTTQPTRPYAGHTDPRRGSYQHTTQPTRSQDPRRYPDNYSTQPTRSYATRRDHYQYNNQPTRPYDPRRDPHQYQTQPTRPHDSRRDPYEYQTSTSVPTRYTYHPYHSRGEVTILNTTPGTRYPAVTHRVYLDHGYYYGYYDEHGRFVVVRTNGDHPQPTRQPHNVGNRNRQATRNPYHDEDRYTQRPLYVTPTPIAFTRQLKVPSHFYFSKNFARLYGDRNHSYLRKAKEFILSLRNSTGGWGRETPRAMVALSLIDNSFANDTYENSMMQKYFQVFLGTSLLRGDTKTTTLSRLAMAINGLLATCQNPKDFYGADLTELIRKQLNQMIRDGTRKAPVNPSVYLSLCLADKELTHYEVHDLMTRLNSHSTPDEYSKDMFSLSITALSCHLQQQQNRDSDYYRSLQSLLSNATSKLLDRMLDDGSFGSVYSTAIAAQALISVNDSRQWNAELTFDYLKQQQLKDGSFGDFLATYWTLPVLSGRSLLHLRNTQCTPPKVDRVLTPSEIMEFTGPKQHIRYSLYIGHPKVNGTSLEILVPQGISFFDIMRVAELQNIAFKFSCEEKEEMVEVYSISNVPNDYERGFQWNLYVKGNTDPEQTRLDIRDRVTGDIRHFYPRSDQHVIFWYHPSDIIS